MSSSSRQQQRKESFKKGIDPADARKKREDGVLNFRKNRREERFRKRRNLGGETFAAVDVGMQLQETTKEDMRGIFPPILNDLKSGNIVDILQATIRTRVMLAAEHRPPVQEVIDAGLVPYFIRFMKEPDIPPDVKFECAWVLTNISSGTSEQTRYVADSGGIAAFAELMMIPEDSIREQAIWALGNIAGDCVELRDRVLSTGVMIPLCECLRNWKKIEFEPMVRTGVWALSNMCRGKPSPLFSFLRPALETLVGQLYSSDEEILTDGCWAVSHISFGSYERRQAVIDVGLCRRLVFLTMHENISIKLAALRTIGNLVSGTNMQTQIVLNVGLLPCLTSLLQHPTNARIRREACWIVSNIMAGDHTQIQRIIEAGFLPLLGTLLQKDDFEIRKEACYALCNATVQGTDFQLR